VRIVSVIEDQNAVDRMWDTTTLFVDWQHWSDTFSSLPSETFWRKFAKQYRGKLLTSARKLRLFLEEYCKYGTIIARLDLYISLRQQEDIFDSMVNKNNLALSQYIGMQAEYILFWEWEVAQNPQKARKLLQSPMLAPYKLPIINILNRRKHIIHPEIEDVVAGMDVSPALENIWNHWYNQLHNEPVEVDGHTYNKKEWREFIRTANWDQQIRIADCELDKLDCRSDVIAGLYSAFIACQAEISRLYKYNTTLERILSIKGINIAIYNKFHKIATRYQLLVRNIAEICSFCTRLELTPQLMSAVVSFDSFHTWAGEITLGGAIGDIIASCAPCGQEYQQYVHDLLCVKQCVMLKSSMSTDDSSEFQTGMGTDTFIRVLWVNDISSVFTLAHEIGHATSSVINGAGFSLGTGEPLQEVPSYLHEILLMRYYREKLQTSQERAHFAWHELIWMYYSLFNPFLTHSFELAVNQHLLDGECALTPQLVDSMWGSLWAQTHGGRDMQPGTWSRRWINISHLYTPFYCWQYTWHFLIALLIDDGMASGTIQPSDLLAYLRQPTYMPPDKALLTLGINIQSSRYLDRAYKIVQKRILEINKMSRSSTYGMHFTEPFNRHSGGKM
jgi:oligoendopeptidase F